jgi:hypothetical protein
LLDALYPPQVSLYYAGLNKRIIGSFGGGLLLIAQTISEYIADIQPMEGTGANRVTALLVGLASPIRDGSEILIIPAVSGGMK